MGTIAFFFRNFNFVKNADCERRLEGKITFLPEMPFNASNQAGFTALIDSSLFSNDLQ